MTPDYLDQLLKIMFKKSSANHFGVFFNNAEKIIEQFYTLFNNLMILKDSQLVV